MSDRSPWTLRQRLVKRSVDLLIATPAVVLASPLIGLATLAARIDTGQSGIFAQQRIGMHGRPVTVYKIRTMRTSGDSTVTAASDPRITPLGRWLRTFKIDELPQLINVVRGDMSLVGPRPDVPGFADLLAGDERVVLAVRPGITGPATLHFRHEELLLATVADPVAYNRDVLYPAKVEMNMAYVLHYSLQTDLRCLAGTLLQLSHREVGTTNERSGVVASSRSA
jgi:lipopolysaccharide/colanic/teichoic acid biosynthesis glycosyltransferase